MKLCVDCKHCWVGTWRRGGPNAPESASGGIYRCANPNAYPADDIIDYVGGGARWGELVPCSDMRRREGGWCGPGAVLFEPVEAEPSLWDRFKSRLNVKK